LYTEIKEKQKADSRCEKWRQTVGRGEPSRFFMPRGREFAFLGNRWCVPDDVGLKEKILTEAHSTHICAPWGS